MRIGRSGRILGVLCACGIAAAPVLGGAAQMADAAPLALAPTVPSIATTVATVPTAASPSTDTPDCYYGACYDYVDGYQSVTSTGLSVVTTVKDPTLNHNYSDEHSLQEISIQNSAQTSTVELGWTVDAGVNGDYQPHLFVYHWVNGQVSCYNGCGYVAESGSGTYAAGGALTPGTVVTLQIQHGNSAWRLSVNGLEIGYFPDSLWSGSFTSGQLNSVFGEVAMDSADVPSCTQMGDGLFGTNPNASWFADYQTFGGGAAPALSVYATSSAYYDQGSVSSTGFHLGGPGSNAACKTP
ncbi:MAG TPA: neprosin family prolyl endopeptidase [Actinospica sp.]|nr:neprosin family prolyl endopeptidase [Actinospica sp.]